MMKGWSRQRIIVFFALIVGILVGALLLLAGQNLSWRSFSTQLGGSLIIASMLALVTEWYLRERLFVEIEGKVTDAFHLQELPSEILDMVRNTVIKEGVIHRQRTAHYDMKQVSLDQEPALRTEIRSTVIYENFTTHIHRASLYEEGADFDYPTTVEAPGFVEIFTENLRGTVTPALTLDKAGMRSSITWREGEGKGQPIFSRPVEFSPGCQIRVTTVEVGYFALDNWDHFTVTRPTIDMEISIAVSGDNFSLSIEADRALIPYDFKPKQGPDGRKGGIIRGALLPGQGMEVRWSPLEESVSQQ